MELLFGLLTVFLLLCEGIDHDPSILHRNTFCPLEFINHMTKYDSVGKKIPFGRSYLAQTFGKAVYLDKEESQLEKNLFRVRSCYLGHNHTGHNHTDVPKISRHLCFALSLQALLIGPEIVVPDGIDVQLVHESSSHPLCEWNFQFPSWPQMGDYRLLIWTHSINEDADPTEVEKHASKTDRHNTGTTVSLSGLGMFDFWDVFPPDQLDFTGHLVRPPYGKAIMAMMNCTTFRRFQDYDSYLAANRTDVATVSLKFFDERVEELPWLNTSTARLIPDPVPLGWWYYKNYPPYIYTFEGIAFNESLVFSLPDKISAFSNNPIPSKHSLCWGDGNGSAGTSLSAGRWVLVPHCEEHEPDGSAAQNNWFNGVDAADDCQQTEPVIAGVVKRRLRGYVWRPLGCEMVEMDERHTVVPIDVAKKLNGSSIFCNVLEMMEEEYKRSSNNSSDRSILRYSVATAHWLKKQYGENSVISTATNAEAGVTVSLNGALAQCMRQAGVGFLAGIGDSLGVEQINNMMNMLGNLRSWDAAAQYGISCTGSTYEHLHVVTAGAALTGCIQAMAAPLVAGAPIHVDAASGIVMGRVKSVVLVTNFMAQHATGGLTKLEAEEALRQQAQLHAALADKLMARNITYRRIFMSAVTIHGFKLHGLTSARNKWFNERARAILIPAGFEVFDVFNITAPRPDASYDGTHYYGGVSRAMTDVLANLLCLPMCRR